MSQVSRRALDKSLEDYIFDNFIRTIARLNESQQIKNFINDLLSPIERTMLIKRLAIAVMLTKGYTYEQIDHTLKVTSPTIKNVSFALKFGKKNGFKKAVEEILKDQRREVFFDKIEELLLQLSPPKLYKGTAYEQKRRIGQELFRRKSLRGNI